LDSRNEYKTISRDSPIPLYSQIRQNIEQAIIEGEYKAGERLPSESKLAEMFNVSRMTVRRAIDQLNSRDIVTRVQGSGTFVSQRSEVKQRAAGITRWSFERVLPGKRISRDVVSIEEISPSLRVATALHAMPGETVVKITWIIRGDEKPLGFSVDYVPNMIAPAIKDWDLGDYTVAELLSNRCGFEFGKVVERVRAISATEEAAEILGVEPGSPLIYVDRLVFLRAGIPTILTDTTYCGDYTYRGRLRPLIDDKSK